MFGKYSKSSSERPPDNSSRHSSGWWGIVESVPLSLKVMFSWDINSLSTKQEKSALNWKFMILVERYEGEAWELRLPSPWNCSTVININSRFIISLSTASISPIDIGSDLLDLQLFIATSHELLGIGDVEEINLQK
jgi:hypothetical protein